MPISSSYSSLSSYLALSMPTLGQLVTHYIGFLSLSPSFLYLGYYRSSYYSLIQLPNSYFYISSFLNLIPILVYLDIRVILISS